MKEILNLIAELVDDHKGTDCGSDFDYNEYSECSCCCNHYVECKFNYEHTEKVNQLQKLINKIEL